MTECKINMSIKNKVAGKRIVRELESIMLPRIC